MAICEGHPEKELIMFRAPVVKTAFCIAAVLITSNLWARGERNSGSANQERGRGESAVDSRAVDSRPVESAPRQSEARSAQSSSRQESQARPQSSSGRGEGNSGRGSRIDNPSYSASQGQAASQSRNRSNESPSYTAPKAVEPSSRGTTDSRFADTGASRSAGRVATVTGSPAVSRKVEVSTRERVMTPVSSGRGSEKSASSTRSRPEPTVVYDSKAQTTPKVATDSRPRSESRSGSSRGSRTDQIVKNDTKTAVSESRTGRDVKSSQPTVSRGDKSSSRTRVATPIGSPRDSGTNALRQTRTSQVSRSSGTSRAPMAGVTAPMKGYDGGRSGRATTVVNNTTIINNNYGRGSHGDDRGGYHDRPDYHSPHYDHHGNWWHPTYYPHHDSHWNFSFSFGYYAPRYHYCHWAPIVYEPIYTPIWNPVVVYDPIIYQPAYVESTYIASDMGATIIYPTRRVMYYGYGPSYTVSYVYPQYHRRYMFVSVGGYWPAYTYSRYYWYGCHPYVWYGAAPAAYAIGDTQVYTYQRYPAPGALVPGTNVAGVEVPDYDGLIQAGQKIKMAAAAEPPTRPDEPTEADKLFDSAVKDFENTNYAAAAETLKVAVRMEPNDAVLPFAYAQALFANNEYEKAAAVVYTALAEFGPQQPEVFYPRGMYKDEDLLTAQIQNLERAVMMDPANVQMQLLLGYHFLGIGQYDKATIPLTVAQRDPRTKAPATALLNLLEKAKAKK